MSLPNATVIRGLAIALKLADDLQHGFPRPRLLTLEQNAALRAADAWVRASRKQFPSLDNMEKIK